MYSTKLASTETHGVGGVALPGIRRPVRASELVGFAAGVVVAPLFALASVARRARVFHPTGAVYTATVEPLATTDELAALGDRLAGAALVRLSGGAWKRPHGPDLLGVALRFRGDAAGGGATHEPGVNDQDLILATMRSIWTLPFAFFTSRAADFLANDYYGAAVFDVAAIGAFELRLVGPRASTAPVSEGEGGGEGDRFARLDAATARGEAVFRLEARPVRGGRHWAPVASVRLEERAEVDQRALAFSPFRDGRGVVPRGAIQAMRAAPYWLSQRARRWLTRRDAVPAVGASAGAAAAALTPA